MKSARLPGYEIWGAVRLEPSVRACGRRCCRGALAEIQSRFRQLRCNLIAIDETGADFWGLPPYPTQRATSKYVEDRTRAHAGGTYIHTTEGRKSVVLCDGVTGGPRARSVTLNRFLVEAPRYEVWSEEICQRAARGVKKGRACTNARPLPPEQLQRRLGMIGV